jgi:hypothetical protein
MAPPAPLGTGSGLSPPVRAAMESWLVAWYQRETQKLNDVRFVINATNVLGFVIFLVVHGLLAIAVYVAMREFSKSVRTRSRVRENEPQLQELELSLEKIAVKTSLHGVLLLSFALAFYFLYLKFVYPITVVPG